MVCGRTVAAGVDDDRGEGVQGIRRAAVSPNRTRVHRPATSGACIAFTPGVATSEFFHYFHTDRETPETVPWTGLQATTRAYAKIIDEVNKLPLSTFQRPEEPVPSR